jgi:hypothetical protein
VRAEAGIASAECRDAGLVSPVHNWEPLRRHKTR